MVPGRPPETPMISHSHKTVFVHIPKCGGQSLETAFLADLGLSWKTRAPLLLRPNDQPGIGPPRLAHLLARQYVDHHWLSAELWQGYFTFALVRDPFARVLSLFNYGGHKGSLHSYVGHVLTAAFERGETDPMYYFVRPQLDFIADTAGTPLVDRVFRLEDLDSALGEIRAKTGLAADVPHANRSTRRAEIGDLNSDDVAIIRALYEADFEAFGYSDEP